MTTALAAPRDGRGTEDTETLQPLRPRRVERWRWFVALAVAGLATTVGLGHLLGAWLAALLIVGAHETGHAVAARGMRIPTSDMVIGFGPRIARFGVRGLPIEIRSVPVVGWVEMDRDGVPMGSPRVAAVYAAGPAASLLLSVAILLSAFAWFQGPSNVGFTDARDSVRTATEAAQGMWAAPFRPVLDLFESSPQEPGSAAATTTQGTPDADPAGDSDPEVSSVVGIAAAAPRNVEAHGAGWVFMALAALSASVAGLNLLPAWGLDGHGIVEELAWTIQRRNPTWGGRARQAASVVGVLTALLGLWLLVAALVGDIVALV